MHEYSRLHCHENGLAHYILNCLHDSHKSANLIIVTVEFLILIIIITAVIGHGGTL